MKTKRLKPFIIYFIILGSVVISSPGFIYISSVSFDKIYHSYLSRDLKSKTTIDDFFSQDSFLYIWGINDDANNYIYHFKDEDRQCFHYLKNLNYKSSLKHHVKNTIFMEVKIGNQDFQQNFTLRFYENDFAELYRTEDLEYNTKSISVFYKLVNGQSSNIKETIYGKYISYLEG